MNDMLFCEIFLILLWKGKRGWYVISIFFFRIWCIVCLLNVGLIFKDKNFQVSLMIISHSISNINFFNIFVPIFNLSYFIQSKLNSNTKWYLFLLFHVVAINTTIETSKNLEIKFFSFFVTNYYDKHIFSEENCVTMLVNLTIKSSSITSYSIEKFKNILVFLSLLTKAE